MIARLPPHISFCSVGERLIFLDTRGDRYFMLTGAEASLFGEVIASSLAGPDASQRLVAAGVLATSDAAGHAVVAPSVEIPTLSLLDSAPRRSVPSPAMAIEVGVRLLAVRRRLHHGGFGALVERMRAEKARVDARTPSDCAGAKYVRQFGAARRFAPTKPNCLLDTLALAGFLTRRRVPATMVIGVKLDPFAAHCWLQDRTRIFNDTYENAVAFAPILVI